jgi:hypothetical protein
VIAGALRDRAGDVGSVPVLVERLAILVDEVEAGEELLAGEVGAAAELGLPGHVRDARVEHRDLRALASRRAALLEDLPRPRGVEPPARLELQRRRRLAAERAAGKEVPLHPLPAAGDPSDARVVRDARVRDVVGHGVSDRRVGIKGLLGGGHADPIRQLKELLRSSLEAHQELPGNERLLPRRLGRAGRRSGHAQ